MILPWWLLSIASVFGAIPALWIREGEGPGNSEPKYEILSAMETSDDLNSETDDDEIITTPQLELPTITTSNNSILLQVPPDLFQVDSDNESECPLPPVDEDSAGNTTSADSPAIKLRRMSFTNDT
jgi:hypothetical protein